VNDGTLLKIGLFAVVGIILYEWWQYEKFKQSLTTNPGGVATAAIEALQAASNPVQSLQTSVGNAAESWGESIGNALTGGGGDGDGDGDD
jgi:hypothetical protein